MKCFKIHLWREWRQNRRGLALLTVFIALCIGLFVFLSPGVRVPRDEILGLSALFGAMVVGMSVGADLFAAERQNGTDAFLRRIPRGLEHSFCAKLSMFVLMTSLAALWGAGVGYCASELWGGNPSKTSYSLGWSTGEWSMILFACSGGMLWCFAVSSWVRRGALTLPATLMFLCLMLAPTIAVFQMVGQDASFWGLRFSFYTFPFVAPLACAFVSYVMGSKRAWSGKRRTLMGVLLASAFATPSWAWAGQRFLERNDGAFEIAYVMIGEDQHFAFITVGRGPKRPWAVKSGSSSTAVLVNLQTGEAWLEGEPGHSAWGSVKPYSRLHLIVDRKGWAAVSLHGSFYASDAGLRSLEESVLFNGRTGRPVEGDPAEFLNHSWAQMNWPEAFARDGAWRFLLASGTGFTVHLGEGDQSQLLVWDPITEIVRDRYDKESFLSQLQYDRLFVLPGSWLARTHDGQWSLIDPESGEKESLPSLESEMNPISFFDDGSFLFRRNNHWVRFWAGRGVEQEVSLLGFENVPHSMTRPYGSNAVPFSHGEPNLFAFTRLSWGQDGKSGLAVFDPETNTITRLVVASNQVAERLKIRSEGEGFAFVQKGQDRLYRVDAESGAMELVFDITTIQKELEQW